MKFVYIQHAEDMAKERNISKKLTEDVINNPEKIVTSKFGRKIAQRIVNGKLLRVVHEKQNGIFIVITAYYTKPERYG